MTDFERGWYDKYMKNMVALSTLEMLVTAGKLSRETVNAWAEERKALYGI